MVPQKWHYLQKPGAVSKDRPPKHGTSALSRSLFVFLALTGLHSSRIVISGCYPCCSLCSAYHSSYRLQAPVCLEVTIALLWWCAQLVWNCPLSAVHSLEHFLGALWTISGALSPSSLGRSSSVGELNFLIHNLLIEKILGKGVFHHPINNCDFLVTWSRGSSKTPFFFSLTVLCWWHHCCPILM